MHRRRSLPSLNALLAFEAAARRLSFTTGAKELAVTQAAVSHQIKALETALGCRLFDRRVRALALTDGGSALLPILTEAFDRIADATARIATGQVKRRLVVSVVPSFAARWLVPRLRRFRKAYPEIELSVVPSADLIELTKGEADVGIRWGMGRYPGLAVTRLLGDELFPVCSPALLARRPRLRNPSDLARHVLLHDDSHADWVAWLETCGERNVDARRGFVFTDASLLIQAATDGLGVAMGRRVLVSEELRAGRLRRPFEMSLPSRASYFFTCAKGRADEPKIAAFRSWLLAEAALVAKAPSRKSPGELSFHD